MGVPQYPSHTGQDAGIKFPYRCLFENFEGFLSTSHSMGLVGCGVPPPPTQTLGPFVVGRALQEPVAKRQWQVQTINGRSKQSTADQKIASVASMP
jgi:hypothetical protein